LTDRRALVQERISPRGTTELLVLRDNGEPLGKGAVQWAVEALAAGYDVPSLRILAGLDLDGWPNSFETETLMDTALRELGVPVTDRNSRALAYVRDVASAIVARDIAPQEGANLIHRRVIVALNHPGDLQAWCCLWEGNAADGSRSLEDSEIDRAIVDYAGAFLRGAVIPPSPIPDPATPSTA
jgi:hypothetical protein